jgi:hypothetical protein
LPPSLFAPGAKRAWCAHAGSRPHTRPPSVFLLRSVPLGGIPLPPPPSAWRQRRAPGGVPLFAPTAPPSFSRAETRRMTSNLHYNLPPNLHRNLPPNLPPHLAPNLPPNLPPSHPPAHLAAAPAHLASAHLASAHPASADHFACPSPIGFVPPRLGGKLQTVGGKPSTLGGKAPTLGGKPATLGDNSRPTGGKSTTPGRKSSTLDRRAGPPRRAAPRHASAPPHSRKRHTAPADTTTLTEKGAPAGAKAEKTTPARCTRETAARTECNTQRHSAGLSAAIAPWGVAETTGASILRHSAADESVAGASEPMAQGPMLRCGRRSSGRREGQRGTGTSPPLLSPFRTRVDPTTQIYRAAAAAMACAPNAAAAGPFAGAAPPGSADNAYILPHSPVADSTLSQPFGSTVENALSLRTCSADPSLALPLPRDIQPALFSSRSLSLLDPPGLRSPASSSSAGTLGSLPPGPLTPVRRERLRAAAGEMHVRRGHRYWQMWRRATAAVGAGGERA